MKKHLVKGYFTKGEVILWLSSSALIIAAYLIFDRGSLLTLTASLIGVTSLIFNAKGNPTGQALMIVFSVLYGIISYSFSYYGEMLTYMGMTAPMALMALISWIKNPYKGNRSEVAVNRLKPREPVFALILTTLVTFVFYFILKYFNTSYLAVSTVSVSTSFIAVYLTFRRSPWFALGYAANDVVLIVLWCLAAVDDTSYISVIVCFAAFLFNDLYGFYNWRKMQKRQKS